MGVGGQQTGHSVSWACMPPLQGGTTWRSFWADLFSLNHFPSSEASDPQLLDTPQPPSTQPSPTWPNPVPPPCPPGPAPRNTASRSPGAPATPAGLPPQHPSTCPPASAPQPPLARTPSPHPTPPVSLPLKLPWASHWEGKAGNVPRATGPGGRSEPPSSIPASRQPHHSTPLEVLHPLQGQVPYPGHHLP